MCDATIIRGTLLEFDKTVHILKLWKIKASTQYGTS